MVFVGDVFFFFFHSCVAVAAIVVVAVVVILAFRLLLLYFIIVVLPRNPTHHTCACGKPGKKTTYKTIEREDETEKRSRRIHVNKHHTTFKLVTLLSSLSILVLPNMCVCICFIHSFIRSHLFVSLLYRLSFKPNKQTTEKKNDPNK